jgi:hypothetical protein
LSNSDPGARHIRRRDLFDRIWSKPMTTNAAELGTTTWTLSALAKRLGLPLPRTGYWMKQEFGKAPPPPDFPADPNLDEKLYPIDARKARRTPSSPAKAPAPVGTDAEGTMGEPAGDAPPPTSGTAGPAEVGDPRRKQVESSRPTISNTEPTDDPQKPVTLTREELHEKVWAKPMSRLAAEFGLSDNGLAKICRRFDIPYPPRGHWSKLAAGKRVKTEPLPPAKTQAPAKIVIQATVKPTETPQSAETAQALAVARNGKAPIVVAERLAKPHAIIAGWLADHDRKAVQARREIEPWRRKLYMPEPLSVTDRRRHRILDALFKALEREGVTIKQDDRRALIATLGRDSIEMQLRTRRTRVRRPLTEREKEWRSAGDKDWRWENQDTDELIFEIKTWLPGDLPRTWKDGARHQIEALVDDIFITMKAAFPMLAMAREKREEAERQRQVEERKRYEEEQRRKLDRNRFRRFLEFAQQWREAQLARDFIAALRARPLPDDQEIAGNSLSDWLAWLERYADRHDPSRRDVARVLEVVAAVHSWTYHD